MYWLALQPQHESAGVPADMPAQPSAGTLAHERPGADAAADPQLLVDAATALGWWALRFTPRVALQDAVVLLEVSASERLFGGRGQLITRLLAEPRPVASIRMAQADTALLALARLQLDGAPHPVRGGGDASDASDAGHPRLHPPDRLPLYTLADARPHLATLERLGCQVWGDLRGLPRGGVVRRFGAPLLDALDRAYGLRPEVYPWLVLPEVFDLPLELMAQVETAPALLFAARRLLAQLQAWLQARQHGVLALELVWQMDARRDTATEGSLLVRTAVPTLDMVHLQRLLAENLERITLPAPVLFLRLRSVETAPLSGATDSLLPDAQRHGDDLVQLLERLAARLGAEQVLRPVACADHRPEYMQDWVPVVGAVPAGAGRWPVLAGKAAAGRGDHMPRQGAAAGSSRRNGSGQNKRRPPAGGAPAAASDALYPTWLLAAPLKLAVRQDRPLYQGPLTLLAGPQRLEAAWWDVVPAEAPAVHAGQPDAAAGAGPAGVRVPHAAPRTDGAASAPGRLALRDYFLARSEQAGLLWIYRERLTAGRLAGDKPGGHWYLHGVFG